MIDLESVMAILALCIGLLIVATDPFERNEHLTSERTYYADYQRFVQ